MEGTGLHIKTFGTPVLHKKAQPVRNITEHHRTLLSRMARLMYEVKGVGLAAPQIGINESLIVVDIGSGLYKLINPRIVKRAGRQSMEEGCLSVPGVGIKVKRARQVTVEAQDESGKPVTIEAEDLLATVFQHELDHLAGKLIVDHASVLEKLKIRGPLRALKKKVPDARVPKSKTEPSQL